MKYILAILMLALCGCDLEDSKGKTASTIPDTPEQIQAKKETEFQITFLFEKEGVKIYRFYDNEAGHYHYFAVSSDKITVSNDYTTGGKVNTYHSDTITTNK